METSPMRRLLFPLAGLVLVVTAGCKSSQFAEGRTLTKDGRFVEVEFKAPKSDRTVSVSVSNGDVAVRVYLVLADDKDEAINAILKGKNPRRILADGAKDMEGKVPGGKPFVVLIRPVKPPEKEVDLRVLVKGY